MKRLITITAIFLFLVGFTAANAHGSLDVGPGMIGADHPLYGLETAWDNAAISIGLKKAGEVAQERAAEAQAAMERNNSQAAARAAQEMSNVAAVASSDDTEGLQKAEAVLQEVIANAPQEAQEGLQTALQNVQQARERAQQAGNASDRMPDDAMGQMGQDGADQTGQMQDSMDGGENAPSDTPDGASP